MRAFTTKEMASLFKITRTIFVGAGLVLIGYGGWDLISPFAMGMSNPMSWFGMFPLYVGAMLILIAAAMKEDWFTDARRYW